MKSLEAMHNVELANLLASLFPEAIPAFLTYMKESSAALVAKPEGLRKNWQENPIVSFDTWIWFAQRVTEIISQYGNKLSSRPSLFADQLFDGLLAGYTRHLANLYVKEKECPPRFRQGIQLVFKG